jgi:Regulator of chromosome condensation (RCC1) repeat
VSAGEYHSLALKTNGNIFAWGYNVYGQAGFEDYRDQLTPKILDCPVDYCGINIWTGAVDTAWENTANWSCASLPGDLSTVYINTGLPHYPVVNSFARCKKLFVASGTQVIINPGFTLDIKGKD